MSSQPPTQNPQNPQNADQSPRPQTALPQGQELVLKVIPMPADCNANGDIFGGWVMAQVDLAGAVLPARYVQGRMATVAVNQFIFKQPVRVGDILSFFAQVTRVGNSSITVQVEVFAERFSAQGQYVKVTEASLTYVAIDMAGRPRTIPKAGLPGQALDPAPAAAPALPPGVQRVAAALAAQGHAHAPVMLSEAARTAQQAADALGVSLGQIAKSIVFRRKNHPSGEDRAVLVITSGDLRVDEHKVQAIVCADGGKLGRADAEFVKSQTGFSIGGVSPLGHTSPPLTLIDAQLFRFTDIWAAAGHPHAVFRLSPTDLRHLTGGAPVHDVTQLTG